MLYSFDIFDTCLIRTCGKRQNLTWALAYRVLGAKTDFSNIRDFVRKRQQAELEAYWDGDEAPTIEQIYQRLDVSYYTSLTNEQILAMEMELELESLVPVADMVKKVEECRQKGRVVFISDMYFPSTFLRPILEKHHLIKEGESLYVSCDHQASKATGNLFEIVKKAEQISFNQWTHYGDDYKNDYLVPRSKGIKAVRICHKNLEFENLCEELSPYSSDKISPSVFAGILRATRLSLGINNDGGFLTGVMCSMLIPFVVACMKDAQKRNIKRLYFASRDAYIMYLIARKFSSQFPEIELKYLYISTKTVFPLAIKDATSEEMQRILDRIYFYQPKSVLKMLGYASEQIIEIGKRINVEEKILAGDNRSNEFVDFVLNDNNISILKENVRQKRELLLEYLAQEGFCGSEDDANVGMVDVGWGGSSQRILKDFVGEKVMYYYFGVLPHCYYCDEMGEYKAFYYTDIVDSNHPKFIEAYVCRNLEGTIVGYEREDKNQVVAVQADRHPSKLEVEDFELRVKIVETAAEFYKNCPFLVNISDEIFSSCSSRILKDVMVYPSKSVASFLADKTLWEDYVEGRPLITKIYPHQYVMQKLFRKSAVDRVKRNVYQWRAACISYTYGRWIFHVLNIVNRVRKKTK